MLNKSYFTLSPIGIKKPRKALRGDLIYTAKCDTGAVRAFKNDLPDGYSGIYKAHLFSHPDYTVG